MELIKKRATAAQKDSLINYMLKNIDFANDHYENASERQSKRKKWEDLAKMLNCMEGAKKTPQQWQKFWQDQRREAKSRNAKAMENILHTSGGPIMLKPLADADKKILSIIQKKELKMKGICRNSSRLNNNNGLRELPEYNLQNVKQEPDCNDSDEPIEESAIVQVTSSSSTSGAAYIDEKNKVTKQTPTITTTTPIAKRIVRRRRWPSHNICLFSNKILLKAIVQSQQANNILQLKNIALQEKAFALNERNLVLQEKNVHFQEEQMTISKGYAAAFTSIAQSIATLANIKNF